MNMMPLDERNYKEVLDQYFLEGNIVVCSITASKTCKRCATNKITIMDFIRECPLTNIRFCQIDYATTGVLQDYYELEQLMDYPKSIIFNGSWDDRLFLEGIISISQLRELNKS